MKKSAKLYNGKKSAKSSKITVMCTCTLSFMIYTRLTPTITFPSQPVPTADTNTMTDNFGVFLRTTNLCLVPWHAIVATLSVHKKACDTFPILPLQALGKARRYEFCK
jgi:hypothetical protein